MGLCLCKQFNQRHLLKCVHAHNLKDLGQCPVKAEFFAHDGSQDVDTHGDPQLRLHRVVAGAEQVFDPQVLFDPLEEEFDPPAELLELRNDDGG